MLNRQRIILQVLAVAGGSLHRPALVKIAFLWRQEPCLAADPTFYDFLPYRFGAFSFALYRELEGLTRDGLIDVGSDAVSLRSTTDDTTTLSARLDARVRDAIR